MRRTVAAAGLPVVFGAACASLEPSSSEVSTVVPSTSQPATSTVAQPTVSATTVTSTTLPDRTTITTDVYYTLGDTSAGGSPRSWLAPMVPTEQVAPRAADPSRTEFGSVG